MLSDEQNRTLTQVGAGTPMGELLRRYWMPIAAVAELDDTADQARAADGRGPRALQGPGRHATASSTGTARIAARTSPTAGSRTAGCAATITAGCGSTTRRCLRAAVRGDRASRGALQGPHAHQGLPGGGQGRPGVGVPGAGAGAARAHWEPFTWTNGFVQIVFSEVPCNWFQCQENSIDPVHFEWLHGNWSRACSGDDGADAADATSSRLRRVRVRLRLPARAARASRRATSCGRSGARACGRTACSPAATSSGACRSTTRTR